MRELIELLTSRTKGMAPVVRWFVLMLVALACIFQLVREQGSSASTDDTNDPVPPARLIVSDDRKALVVLGLIGNGTQAQVSRLLDENSSITTIRLQSAGGRVGESLKIAREVAVRHLSTHVDTECSSTCTAILISGTPRTASLHSKIGFHGTRTRLQRTSQTSTGGDKLMQKFYKDAGLSAAFVDRALGTPPTTIWFPTDGELLTERILTSAPSDRTE